MVNTQHISFGFLKIEKLVLTVSSFRRSKLSTLCTFAPSNNVNIQTMSGGPRTHIPQMSYID